MVGQFIPFQTDRASLKKAFFSQKDSASARIFLPNRKEKRRRSTKYFLNKMLDDERIRAMKVRRTIGGALFGIGCAVTFVGILATVLPMVQNDQLQLVLSSFEMPSGNLIVSAVNGAMTYALHHCYGVLLCGIAMMAVGMGILLRRSRRRPARRRAPSPYSRPASAPAAKPVWPEEDADWSAWKPREARTNPFAGAIYEDLPPRTPSPAVPTAYTPPPILPPSNAEDEPSPYARPFAEPPAPPPWRSLLMRSLSLQHRLWGSGHPRRSRQRRLLWSLPPRHRPCRSRRQRLHHLPFRGWTQLPLFPSRPRRRPYLPIPRLARPARADHA